MFKEVNPKANFSEMEKDILKFWEKEKIFEKSLEQRVDAKPYIFYDGPPFATGLPHYGHLLAGTIKDIVPRYWTMQGRYVPRVFGWDCHGLPVENEAAKDLNKLEGLNLSGKYEIEKYGVGKFNEYCRSIVLKYTSEWEHIVKRTGRWVDFKNGYRTMDKGFMESIWWAFKQLWDKGLVYEGHRVMPFSWKLSTPLSNFEANMNYKSVQDPAITLRFKALDRENTYFLAWTTTPWTLPSNLALAVGANLDYNLVRCKLTGDQYILAAGRRAHYESLLKTELTVLETVKGSKLVDRPYEPLFPYFKDNENSFKVIASEHATDEDGTGIVHMAPAFGEEDFMICKQYHIPLVDPVDMEGRFTDTVTDYKGMHVKDADKQIINRLKEEGKLIHQGTIQHNYPFCWRSETPLIYKAITTWFVRVEDIRDKLLAANEQIHWVPEAVGKKRFGNWLEQARDWNISRNRYWGTPIPIWRCEETGDMIAVGSTRELEELSGQTITDLHSHFIDCITFEKDGKTYKRISEVFDCWFESGSMPYSQNHYPFEHKEEFEATFPADFIAEGLDQTRGWFYTLTVLSAALFDKPAFKNVVVNGIILAEDGQKMSKSKKNYPDPLEIIEEYGADCLRAYLIDSPVVRAEPVRFQREGIEQVFRNMLSPFYNAYGFFVTYAKLDRFEPGATYQPSNHKLDRWIVSRFQTLVKRVTKHMEGSYLYKVIPELEHFTDLLTNWYIRRSRRRFWRAENDADKQHAYNTLYYVLVEFSKVMAPFLPFISEAIYRNLTGNLKSGKPSVHLCDYPKPVEEWIDSQIEKEMHYVRILVSQGRSLRAKHNLKIRQPLSSLKTVVNDDQKEALKDMRDIVLEELNIKQIDYMHDETELVDYSVRPNLKVLGPRLGKSLRVLNPAIRDMSHDDIVTLIDTGQIELKGHVLTTDDFLIDRKEKAGQVVSSEDGITIALDTLLTEELLLEGDARELVNRIQNFRKDVGYRVEDRIKLKVTWKEKDDAHLSKCIALFGDYIKRETLCVSLNEESFVSDESKEWDVNDKAVVLDIVKV
ncbi:MAG: isoleucine--tRNA ligase [Acidobacteria bacterium]|nr:MAG: isoleucine--tRNA ligase [Acidobacteriota bacterium]